MRVIIFLFLIILMPVVSAAKHKRLEREYQKEWCDAVGGVMEYRLHDGTRVDCLTESYAIEFDFSNKWAEAIGQSLYYAVETKRLPGIVLILEKQSDERHLKRLMKTAAPYGIRVWTISNFPTKTKEVQQ